MVAILVLALLASGIATAVRTRRRPDGFLPRRVVTNAGFWPIGLLGLAIFAAYYATLYAAPSLIEEAEGWNSLAVGAALVPAGLCSVIGARWVTARSAATPAWRLCLALASLATVGLLVGAGFGASLWIVLAVALTIGAFAGAQALLIGLVLRSQADNDGESAQGLFNFLAYGRGAVGPAVVGGLPGTVSMSSALAIVAHIFKRVVRAQ